MVQWRRSKSFQGLDNCPVLPVPLCSLCSLLFKEPVSSRRGADSHPDPLREGEGMRRLPDSESQATAKGALLLSRQTALDRASIPYMYTLSGLPAQARGPGLWQVVCRYLPGGDAHPAMDEAVRVRVRRRTPHPNPLPQWGEGDTASPRGRGNMGEGELGRWESTQVPVAAIDLKRKAGSRQAVRKCWKRAKRLRCKVLCWRDVPADAAVEFPDRLRRLRVRKTTEIH